MTSPTAATGTLLRLPTSEKVVAVVVDRNQSEVNEMPKASAADAPAAAALFREACGARFKMFFCRLCGAASRVFV